MVRDWLVSGQWFAPLEFARNYYDHYPFFAVGYWPPLFSVVTGLWLLAAGVGRSQALLIPAVFAAGTGWLVFHFVRQRLGMVVGLCAGALYLSLPAVRQWMCAVMADHMTAFLSISVAACLLHYLKQPVLWNGIFCGVACGCAILSKYSAAYTLALPFLAVLLLRRFELLKKPSLLVQPFVVALIVGPWALWTRGLASFGLPSERGAFAGNRAASFVLVTFEIFPPALMAVVVLGLIVLLIRPRAWREDLVVLSLLCAGHVVVLIRRLRRRRAALRARAGRSVLSGFLRRLVGDAGIHVTWRTLGKCHFSVCRRLDPSVFDFGIRSLRADASSEHKRRCRIHSEGPRAGSPTRRRVPVPRRAVNCRIRRAEPPSA